MIAGTSCESAVTLDSLFWNCFDSFVREVQQVLIAWQRGLWHICRVFLFPGACQNRQIGMVSLQRVLT